MRNELPLQLEMKNFMTYNVFWTKQKTTLQQQKKPQTYLHCLQHSCFYISSVYIIKYLPEQEIDLGPLAPKEDVNNRGQKIQAYLF